MPRLGPLADLRARVTPACLGTACRRANPPPGCRRSPCRHWAGCRAEPARRDRITGAGLDDLDDDAFVENEALARGALIGDEAEIGGRVALQRINAGIGEAPAQRRRERLAGDQRPPEAGEIDAELGGL